MEGRCTDRWSTLVEWFLALAALIGGMLLVTIAGLIIDSRMKRLSKEVDSKLGFGFPYQHLKPLENLIAELPNKILQSITSSANTHKGNLGELIGYIHLRSSYDRIVPLGNIVDFMCIKFPEGDQEGHVDFIDIKTGNRSRLSKDQKGLQKLIEEKRINFVKLKVDTTHDENTS